MIDIDLKPDTPTTDHCGSCTKCLDACPTNAIVKPYVVDGSKCISYFTIELKGAIPEPYAGKMDNWIFGCDVCQQVCPWNRHATKHNEPQFEPSEDLVQMRRSDWLDLTEEVFKKTFKDSPVMRTGLEGLVRNLKCSED